MAGNVAAVLGAGSTFGFDTAGTGTFLLAEGIQSLGAIGDEAESKDKTTISDTRKVYGAGMVDSPDMEISLIYLTDDANQVAFVDACKAREEMDIEVTWPNGTSGTFKFQPFGFSIDETTPDGWIMASVTGKQNTDVAWTQA